MNAGGFRTLWEAEDVHAAVRLLSDQPHLHVFVGAGVSKEAGLPSWSELLDALLRHTATNSDAFRRRAAELRQDGLDNEKIGAALAADAASYSRWLVSTHGLMGAATVVKAWLGDGDYERVVQQHLYHPVVNGRLPLQPGPTAIAIAALWRRLGTERMTVITTNYDPLLERALIEIGIADTEVHTVTNVDDIAAGVFNVVHLHGVLPEPGYKGRSEPAPKIVLAEDEFFDTDPAAAKRSQFCRGVLASGSCLFVGMSFTDPNLLNYLYDAARPTSAQHPHIAIVVRQGEQPPQLDAGATVLAAGREAAAARLARINVTTMQPDFFSQTAHVLGEIQPTGDSHLTFPDRLAAWSSWARTAGRLPQDCSAFRIAQPVLQQSLSVAVDRIHRAFEHVPALRCEGEVLSLHLWIHDPSDESIVFAARSDQQLLLPELLEREPLAMPIRRLVVESVCTGAVLEASGPELGSSRWKSMLVVPLSTSSPSSDPLAPTIPIGALVLASNADSPRGLTRLREAPTARQHLIQSLARIGELMTTEWRDNHA